MIDALSVLAGFDADAWAEKQGRDPIHPIHVAVRRTPEVTLLRYCAHRRRFSSERTSFPSKAKSQP